MELGAGSGTSYPGALDTDASLEVDSPSAGKTKARAAVPNDLAAAIIALQTELGTDPAGTLANVKTFLQTEHETSGAHKASLVVTMSGTQTVTGSKTFTSLTVSGAMTAQSVAVSGSMTFSPVLARASIPAALAYEDEANVFTEDQKILKATPSIELQKSLDSQFSILRTRNAAGTAVLDLGANATSHNFYISDGTTERFTVERTTGKVLTGTVPLARMVGAALLDTSTAVLANTQTSVSIQAVGDVNRFYSWSIRGSAGSGWTAGSNVTVSETVSAGQHSFIIRPSSGGNDTLELVNGSTGTLTAVYKVYEMTEI